MPNSVQKALERFQRPMPPPYQHSPQKWIAPAYGAKVQYSPNFTTTPKLDKRGITRVKNIAGTFLYITRAINPTMLVTLK